MATAVMIAVVLALTSACTPSPEPTPTPTGFASEEEAFAAAEETYRAYVDAVNRLDFQDPSSFDSVYEWTSGELNEIDRKAFSEYHAEGTRLTGNFAVQSVAPSTWDPVSLKTELAVCLDVSQTDIVGADGISTITPDRPAVVPLTVALVPSSRTSTGMAIERSEARQGPPEC